MNKLLFSLSVVVIMLLSVVVVQAQICAYQCFIPSTLGDTENETLNPSGEKSVQEMLDEQNIPLDATSDQTNIQIWQTTEEVQIRVTYLDGVADNNQVFGYYTDSNPGTFTPIFEVKNHSTLDAPQGVKNQSYVLILPSGEDVGFGLETESPLNFSQDQYYTEIALGSDPARDHAIVYDQCDQFVIAFEDSGGDFDYNDMLVLVERLNCGCEDEDMDQVCDNEDMCLDTEKFVPIDSMGCSLEQFCAKQPICGIGCDTADWMDDEEEYPYDCKTAIFDNEGTLTPVCTAIELVCSDP